MRTLVIGLVALAFGMFGIAPQARADIITVHDTVGLPNPNPAWVNGGQPMSIRYNLGPGGSWIASGIRITIDEPTLIHTINGVMAAPAGSSVWTSAALHINVHSSDAQFGSSALLGDVYHTNQGVFFANLVGGQPPAWGGLNSSGNPNRWVELGFEPFLLEPGSYVLGVQAYVVGSLIAWTETLNDFGLPSDIFTSDSTQPNWIEYKQLGSVHGNPAVLIQGTVIPGPGVLPCLGVSAILLGKRRRRNVCAANTTQVSRPHCFSQKSC